MHRPSRARALAASALLLLLTACGDHASRKKADDDSASTSDASKKKGKRSASAGAAASGDAPAPASLTARIDGKGATLTHAIAKKRGDFVQIYLSSDEATCKELLENMWMGHNDAKHVLFDLKREGDKVTVSDFYDMGRSFVVTPGAKVSLEGSTDKDQRLTVTLDLTATENDKEAFFLKGSFVALGCGESPAH